MPIVFATKPGQVVQLDDPALSCSTNFLSLDPEIAFESERSIVTRLTVSQQVNVQFLHTLGALIYIYVFGDLGASSSLGRIRRQAQTRRTLFASASDLHLLDESLRSVVCVRLDQSQSSPQQSVYR